MIVALKKSSIHPRLNRGAEIDIMPRNRYTLSYDHAHVSQNPLHHSPVPCGGGAERTCENDTLIVYAAHLLPVLFIVCYVDSRVDGIKHDAGSVDF